MFKSAMKAVTSALYASTAPIHALSYEIRNDVSQSRLDAAALAKHPLMAKAEELLNKNPNDPVANFYLTSLTGVL